MDRWQILAVIAGVVFAGAMLRLVWIAAFPPGETVSTVPELDRYGRSERAGDEAVDQAPQDRPSNGSSDAAAPADEFVDSEPELGENPDDAQAGRVSAAPDREADDGERLWIELDIEPLFSSSETSRIVDLPEKAEGPEVTP